MSEKRFSPVEGMSSLLVGDNGVAISSVEACDLLNRQAETIEVLRAFIRSRPYIIDELMWAAYGLPGVDPKLASDADLILTTIGINERLT